MSAYQRPFLPVRWLKIVVMNWIDASDIKKWTAQQKHCQQNLPELVRRLILAHASNAVEFTFPMGDRTSAPGWDGRLNTPVVSPFFPEGISGWEMSTEDPPQAKAETDYQKRKTDSLGLPLNETTFVFVTPHAWDSHTTWETQKKGDNAWKNVCVKNVDDLLSWLNSSPAVARWFAHEIHKVLPGGIRALEAFWEEWSVGTLPVMTPELVISGRRSDLDAVQRWIIGHAGTQ